MSEESNWQRLADRERLLGAATLELVLTWPNWVHRRVEQISLEDPVTVRRRVSVDFTLHADRVPLISDGAKQPVFFVPLTLLRKEPLTRFDLRDEGGRALPLLTKRRNGVLAAAMLVALAESIADDAFKAKHGARVPPSVERDLWEIATLGPDDAQGKCDSIGTPTHPDPSDQAWRHELVSDESFTSLANDLANNFVVAVPLPGPAGVRRILKFGYEEHYDDPVLKLPRWLRWLGRRVLSLVSGRRIHKRADRPRTVPFNQWLRRGVGWRPKAIAIETPAVSHGGSYHLEVEAPEGLSLTRGTLRPYWGSRRLPQHEFAVNRTRQRMHLYTADVPRGTGAIARINLRPAPSTIIRAAMLTAAFTTAVLTLVSIRWHSLVGNLGAIPSLLLIVPAGLSAYVARPREPTVTTSVLFGLRIVALAPALWSFSAAAVLVAGRSCSTTTAGLQACENWQATPYILWGLVVLSALVTIVLTLSWLLASRTPEQH